MTGKGNARTPPWFDGVAPPAWMSRSRNLRTKLSRQSALAPSSGAREDRVKPPRSHSRSASGTPTSPRSKPARSTKPTRPASDSDAPRTSCGEADPSTRYCAAPSRRSMRTRSTSNRSGQRGNSSMTTSPSSASRARSGFSRRARSTRPRGPRTRSRRRAGVGQRMNPRCSSFTSTRWAASSGLRPCVSISTSGCSGVS